MKMRKLLLMLAVTSLVSAGTVAWAENPFEEKLPFKSATITYEISGMENGTETLYLDDYGRKSATYHQTVTSMMGMTVQNTSVEIVDGEWLYSYDLVEGTGTKSRNPMSYYQEEFQRLNGAEQEQVRKNRLQLGMSGMTGMGGKVEENAVELLGYSCDRLTAMGTTVYSLHGSSVALKTETDMMGMKMTRVATALDTGGVDQKFFSHPAGIEAVADEEADAMSRQMAEQTIAWLKDPDAASKNPQMGVMDPDNRMQHVPQEDQAEMMQQMEAMMKSMQNATGK